MEDTALTLSLLLPVPPNRINARKPVVPTFLIPNPARGNIRSAPGESDLIWIDIVDMRG
jgi:hypothetical protein